MVQIIDSPKSFGQSFTEGLSQTLPDALGKLIERKRGESQLEEENEALSGHGIDVKGIRDPKIRHALLEQHQEGEKKKSELAEDTKRTQTISRYFGKNAAELYGELTEGGKTKFFESLLHNTIERKIPVDQFLAEFMVENPQDLKQGALTGEMPQNSEGQLPGMGAGQQQMKPNPVDRNPDEGLSRTELTSRQEKRYEKNLPLYEKENALRKGLENESETIEILDELNESKKLPEGLGRVNVNYKEGNLIVPAAANAETQRYVKTVNAFLNKAKDTFGSRVTNFELDRFLQQLPTLANSEEGRREILKQMKYFNSIQKAYQEELQGYIDEKGGIRNVDWDVAERVAEKRAGPKVKQMKDDFKNSEKNAKKIYESQVTNLRSQLQPGEILVEKNGKFRAANKQNFKEAKKKGWKRA